MSVSYKMTQKITISYLKKMVVDVKLNLTENKYLQEKVARSIQ